MEQRKHFQRLTIEEMKAKKEQQQIKKAVQVTMSSLDKKIDEEAEKLAQRLVDEGYDVDEFTIEVTTEQQGDQIIVHLKVVQEGATLVFDLKE